jgi:hypothetical protein
MRLWRGVAARWRASSSDVSTSATTSDTIAHGAAAEAEAPTADDAHTTLYASPLPLSTCRGARRGSLAVL